MVRINVPKRGIGGGNPRVPTGEVQAAQGELQRARAQDSAIRQAGQTIAGIIGQVQAERAAESRKLGAEQSQTALNQLNTFAASEQSRLRRETLQDTSNFDSEESAIAAAQRHGDAVLAERDRLASTIKDDASREAFISKTDERMGVNFQAKYLDPALQMFDLIQTDRAMQEIDATGRLVFETNSPAFLGAARAQAESDPRLGPQEKVAANKGLDSIGYAWHEGQLKGPGGFEHAINVLNSPNSVASEAGARSSTIVMKAQKLVMESTNPDSGSGGRESILGAQAADIANPGAYSDAVEDRLDQLEKARVHLPPSMQGRIDLERERLLQGQAELEAARGVAGAAAIGEGVINPNTQIGKLAAQMDAQSTFELMSELETPGERAQALANHVKFAGATEFALGYVLTLNPLFDPAHEQEMLAIEETVKELPAAKRMEFGRQWFNAMRSYGRDKGVLEAMRLINPDAAAAFEERGRSGQIKGFNLEAALISAERGELFDSLKTIQGGMDKANQLEFALEQSPNLNADEGDLRGSPLDKVQREIRQRIIEVARQSDGTDAGAPKNDLIPSGSFGNKTNFEEAALRYASQIAPGVIADFNFLELPYDTVADLNVTEELASLRHSNFARGEVRLDSPEAHYPGAWALFKLEAEHGVFKDAGINLDYMQIAGFQRLTANGEGVPSYTLQILNEEGDPVTIPDPNQPGQPWVFSLDGADQRYNDLLSKAQVVDDAEPYLVPHALRRFVTGAKEVSEMFTIHWTHPEAIPIAQEAGSLRGLSGSQLALDQQMLRGRYPLGGSMKLLAGVTENYLTPGKRPTRQTGIGNFEDPAPSDADLSRKGKAMEADLRMVMDSINVNASETDGLFTLDQIESELMLNWTRELRAGADRKYERHSKFLAKEVERGRVTEEDANFFLQQHRSALDEFQSDLAWTEGQLVKSQEYYLAYRAFDSAPAQEAARAAQLAADYIGWRNAMGLGLPLVNGKFPTDEQLDKQISEWINRGGMIDWKFGHDTQAVPFGEIDAEQP